MAVKGLSLGLFKCQDSGLGTKKLRARIFLVVRSLVFNAHILVDYCHATVSRTINLSILYLPTIQKLYRQIDMSTPNKLAEIFP